MTGFLPVLAGLVLLVALVVAAMFAIGRWLDRADPTGHTDDHDPYRDAYRCETCHRLSAVEPAAPATPSVLAGLEAMWHAPTVPEPRR